MFSLYFQLFEFIFPASNYNREENLCKIERLYGLKFDINELWSGGDDTWMKSQGFTVRQLEPVLAALKQSKLGVAQS